MKKLYIPTICILFTLMANAQTWTGNANNNWFEPNNWSTLTVPLATGNVIIASGRTNYPILTGGVAIGSINMQAGSVLDVNGNALSLNSASASNYFSGATINNSALNGIRINIGAGTTYPSYIGGTTFNGKLVLTANGTASITEGDANGPNVFTDDVTFNINVDNVLFTVSQNDPSIFNGNLTINRTATGITDICQAGPTIAGNLTFINTAGGNCLIGSVANQTHIGGKLVVDCDFNTPGSFQLLGVTNNIPGGSLNVWGSKGFHVEGDTIQVDSVRITNYKDGDYGYLINNEIISPTLQFTSNHVNSGGFQTYIRGNAITGNTTFNHNLNADFNDADGLLTTNNYNGDVSYTINSSAHLNVGIASIVNYRGALSIIRNATGATNGFDLGGEIKQGLVYINNVGGSFTLGDLGRPTIVKGKFQITHNDTTGSPFELLEFDVDADSSSASFVNASRSKGFNVRNNTLRLNNFSITNYRDGRYGRLYDNIIEAPVTIQDDGVTNGVFSTTMRGNHITGNTSYTHGINSGLDDADVSGSPNTYIGNVQYIMNGPGDLHIGTGDTVSVMGQMLVERQVAGTFEAFHHGGTINGDVTYTNIHGGRVSWGGNARTTNIIGKLNFYHETFQNLAFTLNNIENHTGGGSFDVKGSKGFTVTDNSLRVNHFNITNYTDGIDGNFYRNHIDASVTIDDDGVTAGNRTTNIRGNTITGDCTITHGINSNLNDADIASSTNRYKGNVRYVMDGTGGLRVAVGDTVSVNGNLSIERTVTGDITGFKKGGTIAGTLSINNPLTGDLDLGVNVDTIKISDTVRIHIINNTPQEFKIKGMANTTGGGYIKGIGTLPFDLQDNNLVIDSLILTGYTGNKSGFFYDNHIKGVIQFWDDPSYSTGYNIFMRNNQLEGNVHVTSNGSSGIFAGNIPNTGNTFKGNLYCTRMDGIINIGNADTATVHGDLILNSGDAIVFNRLRFAGAGNSMFNQIGTQQISIPNLIMAKSPGGRLILNTPLTVTSKVALDSGIIESGNSTPFILTDNASYTGSSNSSFVDGLFEKIGNDVFIFPVGDQGFLAPLHISAPGNSGDRFVARYLHQSPHGAGYDTSLKNPGINHVSGNEHWILNRTAGTSNVSVHLSHKDERSGSISNQNELLVIRWNGSTWVSEGNGGFTGTAADGTVQSVAPVNDFSPFTIASSSSNNPLPVSLVSFTARLYWATVNLRWITANEINVDRYEVERSNNANSFNSIITLSASNTETTTRYDATDRLTRNGTYSYRLKMIDNDGNFTYSEIINVLYRDTPGIVLYPNPVQDRLYISGALAGCMVQVISTNGKLMNQQKLTGNNLQIIELGSLTRGMYVLQIIHKDKTITKPFIKD